MTQTTIKPHLRVFFYAVKTAKEKLDRLIEIAESHIEKSRRLLILTDSAEAAEYIQKILWSHSPLSFIPHTMDRTKKDLILIIQNLDDDIQGSCLLNLTQLPIEKAPGKVTEIYELEDGTSKAKLEISKAKYTLYKAGGHHLHYS